MGIVKYALYDSIKSGIKGLRVKPKEVKAITTEPTETQKMIHELFVQAKTNNEQLARQVEHMMQAHMDLAKVLLDAIKQMHGM